MEDPIMTVYLIVFLISCIILHVIEKAYYYKKLYGKNLKEVMRTEHFEDKDFVNIEEAIKWNFASHVREKNIEHKSIRKEWLIFLVFAIIMTTFYANCTNLFWVLKCAILLWLLIFLYKKYLWKKLEIENNKEKNAVDKDGYDARWFDIHWIHKTTKTIYDEEWYNKDWRNKYWFTKDKAIRTKDGKFKSWWKKFWFYRWIFVGIVAIIYWILYGFD